MSVKPIIASIDSNNNRNNKIKLNQVQNKPSQNLPNIQSKNVSFQGGANPIVGLMDFIEAGGYAASFIIQDGLGFITPRVGKGLVRGGKKKKDENGNDILDKNGKPKRELNWAYARKEALREVITGPSAFVIPYFMLKGINKKFGAGNNVKLNYLDSFGSSFADYAKANVEAIKNGKADKTQFYDEVFKDVVNKTINTALPDAEKLSNEEIESIAKSLTQRQLKIEQIQADKSLNKKARNAKIEELGGTVEDAFMKLKKGKIGGAVNEMSVQMTSSKGDLKGGSIGELTSALNDYFGDAVHNLKKSLKDDVSPAHIEDVVSHFSKRRMGSRIFTNLGIFAVVAAAYTQIPKLYNLGTHGKNPALVNEEEENAAQQPAKVQADAAKSQTAKNTKVENSNSAEKAQDSVAVTKPEDKNVTGDKKKDVPFTGLASILEKTGEKVFNGKHSKSISDIFELNGPIISGSAMPVLLYGFCIPPRLKHAQDKYDYGEIVVRDMTAFTALLFGAKALARLFSDGFTKITGLALNSKDLKGRNVLQKIGDYLNPHDTRHSVLTSKQLNSKYTHLEDYKNGVEGFMDFIEQSGGNVKKAFAQDKKIKDVVEKIVKDFNGKAYVQATADEIKEALKLANRNKQDFMKKEFYSLFDHNNGLLNKAKTCNSTFGFLSTLVLVPGLIVWLTDVCEKMTERRKAKEKLAQPAEVKQQAAKVPSSNVVASNTPTMAGFLKK